MSQSAMQQALDALNHIVRRLQMDIDDGGRPDHWSMEDLVRKANPVIATLEKELSLHTAGAAGPIGMPLAWIYEDELPDSYPYDKMFPHSEVRSGVRMFPVFGPPAIEANDAKDAAWVKRIRELVEQLCSAAVAYGEHDTKDAENAYYAAKAHLIDACGVGGTPK